MPKKKIKDSDFEELLEACREVIYTYHEAASPRVSSNFEEALTELEEIVGKYGPIPLPEEEEEWSGEEEEEEEQEWGEEEEYDK